MLKHGASFDEAVSVFGDARALTFSDTDHSEFEIAAELMDSQIKRAFWWLSTRNAATAVESLAQGRQHGMKKASMKMADQNIPELKRDELGKGVRGKYLKHFMQGSNVVVLQPEIQKAFPDSEAVNKALASMLAFAQETQGMTNKVKSRKRSATTRGSGFGMLKSRRVAVPADLDPMSLPKP